MSVAELLHTEDPAEQEAVIQRLAQAAQAPVIVLTGILDTRDGAVRVLLNGNYSFDEMYAVLDILRRDLMKREREALVAKE